MLDGCSCLFGLCLLCKLRLSGVDQSLPLFTFIQNVGRPSKATDKLPKATIDRKVLSTSSSQWVLRMMTLLSTIHQTRRMASTVSRAKTTAARITSSTRGARPIKTTAAWTTSTTGGARAIRTTTAAVNGLPLCRRPNPNWKRRNRVKKGRRTLADGEYSHYPSKQTMAIRADVGITELVSVNWSRICISLLGLTKFSADNVCENPDGTARVVTWQYEFAEEGQVQTYIAYAQGTQPRASNGVHNRKNCLGYISYHKRAKLFELVNKNTKLERTVWDMGNTSKANKAHMIGGHGISS